MDERIQKYEEKMKKTLVSLEGELAKIPTLSFSLIISFSSLSTIRIFIVLIWPAGCSPSTSLHKSASGKYPDTYQRPDISRGHFYLCVFTLRTSVFLVHTIPN